MTPQLQQAIKLLQLTNLELAEYIEQELESNPLLERQEGERPERGDAGPAEETRPDGKTEPDSTALSSEEGLPAPDDGPLDINYGDVYDGSGAGDTADTPAPGPTDFGTVGSGGTAPGSSGFSDGRGYIGDSSGHVSDGGGHLCDGGGYISDSGCNVGDQRG